MNSATFVCEIPYAEMTKDSYDPSGWLSCMDLVCDGDAQKVYVICTEDVNKKSLTNAAVNMEVVAYAKLEKYKENSILYENGNVRLGNLVISKTEWAQANLDWIDAVMSTFGLI